MIDFLKSKGYTVDMANMLDPVRVLIEAVVFELDTEIIYEWYGEEDANMSPAANSES